MHVPQWNVRCREHDAQRVSSLRRRTARRQHHRDFGAGKLGKHLGVTGITVAAGKKGELVDGRSDNSLHQSLVGELHRTLDRQAAEATGCGHVTIFGPPADGLVNLDAGAARTDDHKLRALADSGIGERFVDYFRPDPARIARGYG
jgi:hypothetical protein